jgi:hypothetical protein
MIIVTRAFSSEINSSILEVAIGSSAEDGSSNRRISGFVASARAMQSRAAVPQTACRPTRAVGLSHPTARRRSSALDLLVK